MRKIYLLLLIMIYSSALMAQDCPGDIVVNNDPGICGAVVDYAAPSPAGATVTQIDESGLTSGDQFPVGETLQEYELDYGIGGKDTCSFTVTVNDTEAPLLSCQNISVNNDPGEAGAEVTIPVPYHNNPAVTETVDVLLLYADYDSYAQDVKAKLLGTGNFSTVHTFNISSRVPELEGLLEFDVIMLWRNGSFPDPEALGNVLAGFVDAGRGLVMAGNALSDISYLAGAFETDEYGVIVPGYIQYGGQAYLGDVHLTSHPLMNSITSFDGGLLSYRSISNAITPGSYRVADWTDGNPLIAAKENVGASNARRVDLNFFPPTVTDHGRVPWDVNTDGDLIMANAILWVAGAPIAYDNCGPVEFSNNFNASTSPSGYYPIGSTSVTLNATDEAGNTSTCNFTVTVEDIDPPVAICKNISVVLDENGQVTIEGSDVDGGSTDNHAIATYELDTNTFDDSMLGENTVVLTVIDEAGNSSTCTATVQVFDNNPPDIVVQPIEVALDNTGNYELTLEDLKEMAEGTTDNGTSFDNLKFSAFPTTFACENVGEEINVRLTVEDESGNSDKKWTSVTVVDIIPPTVVCQNIEVYLDENGEASITPEEINVSGEGGSYDACGIASLELDKMAFGCEDTGENNVVLSVTDHGGNTGSCTAIVTVKDTFPPVFEPVADIVVEVETNITETTIDYPNIVVTDNCSVTPELTEGLGPDGVFPVGTTTETWAASDPAGNSMTLTFTVTVTPVNSPPVLVNPIVDQAVNASYVLKVPVRPELGEVFDDVDGDELTISAMLENGDPLPAWAEMVDDSLVFTPLIADTGCVSIIVKATDPDGAAAADTFQLCVDGYPVSSPAVDAAALNVTLYPNPTRDRVTIEVQNSISGPAEISVYTMDGKRVLQRNYTDNRRISFSMKEHVSGMYFVKLNLQGKEIVKKLVLNNK
jgi:hypothetical protein